MSKATRSVILALASNGAAYLAVAGTVGYDTINKVVKKAKRKSRRE